MKALAAALALSGCAGLPAERMPVRYVDAHSHLLDHMTPAAEIAAMRAAGVAGVVIMHPDAAALEAAAAAAPGYVVPFISIARLPEMPGIRLGAGAADALAALHRARAVCGFGEIPTRVVPRHQPTDAAALLSPERMRIYALAHRLGAPVNMHVDIADAAVAASISRIALEHPNARLILAHAGWSAGPETIAALMAAHANVHADLSVRLDPAGGLPTEPLPPGSQPPGAGTVISVLEPDGALRPDWRALIERFPDRFMFAMDITQRERPRHIARLVAAARDAFGRLPPRVEQAVAHGNIERLVAGCARRFAR